MIAGRPRWWSSLGVRGRRELLLVALLLFCYGFFQQRPAWNENSRYDLVRALVDQGTTRIDSYQTNTGDKAFYGGHWYSDKAPGSALLGVPVYALLTLTARVAGQEAPSDVETIQALAFVESGIATALLVILLLRFLGPLVGERWALVVGLAYGFGSIAFPFATMFFGHATSAVALFGSFYLLHRLRETGSSRDALAAGFLAGLAVLIEIPTVIGVGILGLYALWIARRGALAFIAGGIPLALVFGVYNWVSFGGPLNLGYQNLLPGSFASGMSEGILGVRWPDPETAGELLFGPRGLVRLAPWFILVPAGLLALRSRAVRAEVLVCAAITLLFFAYNAGYYLPFGGWTPGPRFLLPALPFAAVLVALIPRRVRIVAMPLMLFAVGVFVVATATMPNAPERYADPLFQLWLPRFGSGDFAEVAAWLRWGLDQVAGVAVLGIGAAIALLVLVLSFGRDEPATPTTGRGVVVLAVMVVAFSFPFPPLAPVALGWQGDAAPPEVEVVEIGHATLTVGGVQEVELWARVENRGSAFTSSRAQFSVWRATGEGVWSAWYGSVAVPTDSRQQISMIWQPGEAGPGTYRYGFKMTDAGSGEERASVTAPDLVVLGR